VGRKVSGGDDRTSPAGSTGTLKCAPRPPPKKVNKLLSGHSQRHHGHGRGHPSGKGSVGPKVFAEEAWKRRIPDEKQTAVLSPGREMAPRVHRNALDQAELSPPAIGFTSVLPDTPS